MTSVPAKPSEKGLKKLIRSDDETPVLVIDQHRKRLKTHVGHGWFKQGVREEIDVTEQWESTKFLGALSDSGETRFFRCESDFNSEVAIHFLRSLQQEFGEELIVVLDNAPYFTSKKVQKFAADNGIELCYLPRYSPQMNPIEECWRQLNQKIKNRVFETIDDMSR